VSFASIADGGQGIKAKPGKKQEVAELPSGGLPIFE
jgi:hypothetical protein